MNQFLFQNIHLEYKKPFIKNLTLSFQEGEKIGIVGPNGAGKSTLFKIASGILKPQKGDLIWKEKIITSLPLFKRAQLGLGYLPQNASLFAELTVQENLEAPLLLKGQNRRRSRLKVTDYLKQFHLSDLISRKAQLLSGGEARRCQIVRLLLLNPDLLLLDEPFSGVDPISIQQIKSFLQKLKEIHPSLILVITDHNILDLFDFCEKILVLMKGELILSGPPQVIQKDPFLQKNYLGPLFSI